MPLLYSIDGLASPYARVDAIAPSEPARSGFAEVIAAEAAVRAYVGQPVRPRKQKAIVARDLMTRNPASLAEDATVEVALGVMRSRGFRHPHDHRPSPCDRPKRAHRALGLISKQPEHDAVHACSGYFTASNFYYYLTVI